MCSMKRGGKGVSGNRGNMCDGAGAQILLTSNDKATLTDLRAATDRGRRIRGNSRNPLPLYSQPQSPAIPPLDDDLEAALAAVAATEEVSQLKNIACISRSIVAQFTTLSFVTYIQIKITIIAA